MQFRKYWLSVLLFVLLPVALASAQTEDDLDDPDGPIESTYQGDTSIQSLQHIIGCRGPCPPVGIIDANFTGNRTQVGRIFRNGVPSQCEPPKPFPGTFLPGSTFNLEEFVFFNCGPLDACVTVNFDPSSGGNPCGFNAHSSAYLDFYDPNNKALNYVGDVGGSLTQTYSFVVPSNTNFVLVFNTNLPGTNPFCDFSFEVVDVPCQREPELCIRANCVETVNPHGKKVPPAGSTTLPGPKGGQNEDGFYQLLAHSVCDPNPDITVEDLGSGTLFPGFVSGDKIKYTQAPGATPNSKKIGSDKGQADAIAAHITGIGDAGVFAVDLFGNVSNVAECRVPPPPK